MHPDYYFKINNNKFLNQLLSDGLHLTMTQVYSMYVFEETSISKVKNVSNPIGFLCFSIDHISCISFCFSLKVKNSTLRASISILLSIHQSNS